MNLDDPRMSVGWTESPTPARVQDFNTQRWTSPAQDQPFMWDTDYGPRYVVSWLCKREREDVRMSLLSVQ